MALIYKMTEDKEGKKVVMADEKGLPIVFDDEREEEFGIDAIHLLSKVPALQSEAKDHRLKAKDLSEKLKLYDELGIKDPAKAAEALRTVASLSAGDLTKKEEVERLKKETENAWKEKFEGLTKNHLQALLDKDKALQDLEDDLHSSFLSTKFATSPHFSGKEPTTKLPPDIAETYFGRYFKVEKTENGKRRITGYLGNDPIYSKARPGDLADFNESMDIIIDAYPMKDMIIYKSSGSGATGGAGGMRHQTIRSGDAEAFGANLEAIASGKVVVV